MTWRVSQLSPTFIFLFIHDDKSVNILCNIFVGVLTHRANLIAKEHGDDGLAIICAHHRTLETLEMSAAQGCHICQAFWLQVSEIEQDALRATETKRLLATPSRPPEKPEPDNLQEYFGWLTFTLLLKEPWGSVVDYVLMLKFSGEGIDWKSVSPKDTLALGLHTFQICYST